MAAELEAEVLARRAVGEGDVVVGDVVEEVDVFFVEKEAGADRVDWGVAPAFVEEAAVLVEGFEEVDVGFGSEEVEVADFKVGPLFADQLNGSRG